MLSGDISLNPGPCQYLSDKNKDLFESFRKRGFHFLHINVNSLLLKIDELRDIISRTKPAILGITESKLDSSVSDQEVNISGYSKWLTYASTEEMFFQTPLNMCFSIFLFQK